MGRFRVVSRREIKQLIYPLSPVSLELVNENNQRTDGSALIYRHSNLNRA